MKKTEQLEALNLFSQQSERLYNSRFVNYLKENKKIGFNISAKKGGNVTTERRWPDEDAINAFILPFRFLIQDNERCSFRNINKLYQELDISNIYKDQFSQCRSNLNNYLDEKCDNIKLKEGSPTRREIMEVFIYGYFAHSQPDKRERFDKWMRMPFMRDFLYFEFVNIIIDISDLTNRMSEQVNKEVIKIVTNSMK